MYTSRLLSLTFTDDVLGDIMQMLSGIVHMLVDPVIRSGSSFDSWRDHAKRLAIRSQSIYVRALLSRLAGDEWMDVLLEEMTMPLRERLAIALLFLPDDQVRMHNLSIP